ncbi:efflux RND transporter periplasmic adaptor subunit [Rhodosalinus halophilus]|uniref:Efflux RND transporter periplasmic adaptor subunit n=1 Tax=Rhodosalinus halophilus TaxID=2259333 RepID=A0A365U6R3_9RHOB|nr:efflux RND transporter periplasmic adaptor subunit [Rhodosalinus halophilus]RBI83448.1 efflux RND transporter periplasmic adaptor subunit [Rhodosalinus halophilus]
MRGRYSALAILALAGGTAGGIALERFYLNPANTGGSDGPEILYWVAPMDPNFRQPGPGKSPMGMDLIPVYAGQEPSGDPAEVSLSAAEINAIGVRTALARMTDVAQRIETVGFVGYNEHRTSHVHTRVEGWIERLEVRAVGDRVEQGQVLFDLFSPLVAAATGDLIRAVEDGDPRILDAARNKLISHGMSPRQIAEIEQTRQLARNVEIEAPQDGVVIALDAADGMYLQPGTRAFSIADLAQVWLIVDVFERDMARLSEDMTAVARFEHLPGRVFEGEIDYIYPELDPRTRTLPVRLSFDNSDGLLRPGMFGTVSLVPNASRQVLTVPSEAVIRTGAAERVILRTGEGTFRPRLVTTGLRDSFGEGGRTEILQGLAPGEEVVASAQFLIDSESALSAGFTRMAPTDEDPARGTGTLVALDRDRRLATLRHDALESLDWPAMTSEFPVRADVALERLREGEEVAFRAARGADGLLGLIELGPDDGVAATGTGIALGVTPEGRLTLDHDPIPDLGWPAMRMDLDVAGLDPAEVPLETPIEFDLARDEAGMFSIIAVRAEGEDSGPAQAEDDAAAAAAPPIVVSGVIDAIDPATRQATITHGPIAEIGMPGMTMDFALDAALDPGGIETGREMTLTFARPDGMTMVLASADPVMPAAPPIVVTGTIDAIDAVSRQATITHGPIIEIGMPGMTMDFAVDPALDPATLGTGTEMTLTFARPDGMTMVLEAAEPIQPPMEVSGTINAVDAEGRTANVTHGPMIEIGMPGMTMDFVLGDGIDPAALPTGEELTLLLQRNPDFSMTLVGTAAPRSVSQ